MSAVLTTDGWRPWPGYWGSDNAPLENPLTRAPLTEEQRKEVNRLSYQLVREMDQAKCEAIEARLNELDPVPQQ